MSDQLEGESQSYFDSGEIHSKTTYQLGKKTGPYELWSAIDRPEEKGSYLKDQLHGQVQRWYSTGVTASVASYDEGTLEGVTQFYTLSKMLILEIFYKNGAETARIEYYGNGRFKRVLIVNKGQTQYERKWNKAGVEETEDKFILGTKLDSEFYLSGFLKYECIYKNGLKHGMEWWFDKQRSPTKLNLYIHGESIISYELTYETRE